MYSTVVLTYMRAHTPSGPECKSAEAGGISCWNKPQHYKNRGCMCVCMFWSPAGVCVRSALPQCRGVVLKLLLGWIRADPDICLHVCVFCRRWKGGTIFSVKNWAGRSILKCPLTPATPPVSRLYLYLTRRQTFWMRRNPKNMWDGDKPPIPNHAQRQ